MKRLASVLLAVAVALSVTPVAAQEFSPYRTPSGVLIPGIGLEAPVVPVALDVDGAMAAPGDPDTVGWYELGPGIGAPGNAVLAGHVDWGGSLRTFGLLHQLRAGDLVAVADLDGGIYHYRVVWSQMFDAATAPVAEIFAQGAVEELTLITCGGIFDSSTGEYLGRLVVRAEREWGSDAPFPGVAQSHAGSG